MPLFFNLVRYFPFWAFPVGFAILELGMFFRRKKHKLRFTCWGIALLLFAASVAWIVFRGDLHSEAWVRSLVGENLYYYYK